MKRNGKPIEEPKPVPRYVMEEETWAYSEGVYPKLARKYPNRWVAVAHHKIIASGTNLMRVFAAAQRKTGWEQIPLVFVERGIHVYLTHGHRACGSTLP